MATLGEKAKKIVLDEVGTTDVVDQIAGNNRYIAVTKEMVYVGSTGAAAGSLFGGAKVKRYPIDSISSVDVQKGMMLVTLEIVMSGAKESKVGAGFMDVAQNENITVFPKDQYARVQQIAGLILQLRSAAKSVASGSAPESKSIPDQIRQLAELKDAGILSEEEFLAKKTELLGRM